MNSFSKYSGKRSFQLGDSKEHYFGAMQEQQTFLQRVKDGMNEPLKIHTVYKDVKRDS